MNILSFNISPQKQYQLNFQARTPKNPELQLPAQLEQDLVEIRPVLPKELPQKFELTDLEQTYNEEFMNLHRLEMNISTQKSNLKSFYSHEDRCDYRRLLSRRQNILAKLRRIAKNGNMDQGLLEREVSIKKEYNRYAPKIYRATTRAELKEVENLISSLNLYARTTELLTLLIKQRRKLLK